MLRFDDKTCNSIGVPPKWLIVFVIIKLSQLHRKRAFSSLLSQRTISKDYEII